MTEEVFLCKKSEITEGRLTSVDVEGIRLMVTLVKGKYIVASRICTHKTFDLTKGYFADGYVTCTLHTSTFDLEDGNAMNPPATDPLDVYQVVEKDEDLYIVLD
jgi:3-phenylpropionate/trans-cinnamate dioxygenase ferredoxin component